MLGLNRTTKPKGKRQFEFMRIEDRLNEIVFVAQPAGKPGVEFPLLEMGVKVVVFENERKTRFPDESRTNSTTRTG